MYWTRSLTSHKRCWFGYTPQIMNNLFGREMDLPATLRPAKAPAFKKERKPTMEELRVFKKEFVDEDTLEIVIG